MAENRDEENEEFQFNNPWDIRLRNSNQVIPDEDTGSWPEHAPPREEWGNAAQIEDPSIIPT